MNKYNKTEFGNVLKTLRNDKKLSQRELAKQLNISDSIVCLWEKGLREPTLSNLVILSDFFEISLDELAGIKQKSEHQN